MEQKQSSTAPLSSSRDFGMNAVVVRGEGEGEVRVRVRVRVKRECIDMT